MNDGRQIMEVGRVPTTYSPKAAPPAPAEPRAQSAPAPQTAAASKGSSYAKAPQAQVSLADLELTFKVKVVTDDSTGRQVVKILSQDGKRVLRQMPPEQALELAAAAREGSVRNLLTSLV